MFPEPGAMLNGGGELNQLRAVERLGSYCSCSSHSIEKQRRQQGISRRAPPVWDARDAKTRASASVARVTLTRLLHCHRHWPRESLAGAAAGVAGRRGEGRVA